jgi:hypothetical protein
MTLEPLDEQWLAHSKTIYGESDSDPRTYFYQIVHSNGWIGKKLLVSHNLVASAANER